jgi:hypothetical protein
LRCGGAGRGCGCRRNDHPIWAGTLGVVLRTAQALGFVAWLLAIAWLVLLITDHARAAGWCLLIAGLLLLVAGPIFQRVGDAQLRITGVVVAASGVFMTVLGAIYVF